MSRGNVRDRRNLRDRNGPMPDMRRETQDQDDELLALASIYDSDLFHVDAGKYTGHFFAHVELPRPFHIVGLDEMSGAKKSDEDHRLTECQVDYLPPITLKFRLPPDYPLTSMPCYKLACNWLSKKQLSDLCVHLDYLWKENKGEVILFSWTSFLTDCLSYLHIENELDLSWVTKHIRPPRSADEKNGDLSRCAPRNPRYKIRENGDPRAIQEADDLSRLLPALVEYNQNQIEKKFLTSPYSCSVCFEQKCGADCIRFQPCNHICCKDCMKSYFEVQIKEGNVNNLTCPEEKCSSQATPSQVRELVGNELFAKYDSLLLTSTLDSMSDIVYCPRQSCQCAILSEPGSTMGTCPACFFVFCVYCRMAYHGVAPCRLKSKEFRLLYESYINGTQQEKAVLESRYGKLQIRHLIESTLSEGWMEENSKECPHCKAHIEKIDGCNKMTCWKCNKFFCWRCMAKLSEKEPYKHFDEPGTGCFALLFAGNFHLQEPEEEEINDDGYDGEFGQFVD